MATTLPIVEPTNWPEIMEAHRGWLASVVYARVRDSHAVDEVLQETALAASQYSTIAQDANGVCKWLYRVAVRQAMLYRRKSIRLGIRERESTLRKATVGQIKCEAANPVRLLIASENIKQVQCALRHLGKRDVEILMLKYRDGWSCRDMASRLGVSESALKSRLLRARNNLRQELLKLEKDWELS